MYDLSGSKFKEYFDANCLDVLKAFEDFRKKMKGIKKKKLDIAIISLVYFCFDFGMASGPETIKRDNLRDSFNKACNFKETDINEIEPIVINYLNAYKSNDDNTKRSLAFGNVFASLTGNENNIAVIMWVNSMFALNYKFVTESVTSILPGLP